MTSNEEQKQMTGKHTIMVVDDELAYVGSLESLLSKHYHVVTAQSGREALDKIKEMKQPEGVSLIISDQRMPGMTGIELFEEVKHIIPDTIRVILTGYDDKDVMLDAINKAKVYEFILKPIDANDLRHRVKRCIEVVEDKKRLKEYQAQLIQAEKMAALGNFAAGIAHEINNPACIALGNADLMIDDMNGLRAFVKESTGEKVDNEMFTVFDEKLNELDRLSADIEEGILRICDFVKRLCPFEKIAWGKRKTINLIEELNHALNTLDERHERSIAFETEFQSTPIIEGYHSGMKDVFHNLLRNACRAIEEKKENSKKDYDWQGKVIIRVKEEENNAVIRFQDNGIGMSDEVQRKMFDPIFNPTEGNNEMDLGLALIFNIVKYHKGRIDVESTPGNGSTITLYLPCIKTKINNERRNKENDNKR